MHSTRHWLGKLWPLVARSEVALDPRFIVGTLAFFLHSQSFAQTALGSLPIAKPSAASKQPFATPSQIPTHQDPDAHLGCTDVVLPSSAAASGRVTPGLNCAASSVPILRLADGPTLNRALGTGKRFNLTLSALSQNNGTSAGLREPQLTSSNLFNLGLQIKPFTSVTADPSPESKLGLQPLPSAASRPEGFHDRLLINALFTQRFGSILSEKIPNVLNTQWNYGNGPISRLNILSLEYRHPRGLLSSVKLGKLMQAQDFTVDPVQCYFSNFGLCGWAQGTPYMVSIPGNPFNSYGAVLKIGADGHARLKYGVYQLAPDTFATQYHGLDFRFDQADGTAHFLELNLPLNSPAHIEIDDPIPVAHQADSGTHLSRRSRPRVLYETPLPATNITVGGWMANGRFATVSHEGHQPSYGSQNNALYAIASLRLPSRVLGLDNRVFLSSSVGFTPDVQNFRSGGNAGLVLAGLVPGRPFDTLNLGMAYASFNPSYLQTVDAKTYSPSNEVALEFNYNIAINHSISVMPNFQYIIRPNGDSSRPGVCVLGLQVWLQF